MKAACTFVLTGLLVSGISMSAKNFLEPPDTQKTDLKLPSPEESAASFSLPEGFKVNVFAAEPDVRQPIAMTFRRPRALVGRRVLHVRRPHIDLQYRVT